MEKRRDALPLVKKQNRFTFWERRTHKLYWWMRCSDASGKTHHRRTRSGLSHVLQGTEAPTTTGKICQRDWTHSVLGASRNPESMPSDPLQIPLIPSGIDPARHWKAWVVPLILRRFKVLTQLQQSSVRALLPRAMETTPGLSCHAVFFEKPIIIKAGSWFHSLLFLRVP